MLLTGLSASNQRKPCPSATLSTTKPTRTKLSSNPSLRCYRLATSRLSRGTAFKTQQTEREREREKGWRKGGAERGTGYTKFSGGGVRQSITLLEASRA
jgi:hypothetical protein